MSPGWGRRRRSRQLPRPWRPPPAYVNSSRILPRHRRVSDAVHGGRLAVSVCQSAVGTLPPARNPSPRNWKSTNAANRPSVPRTCSSTCGSTWWRCCSSSSTSKSRSSFRGPRCLGKPRTWPTLDWRSSRRPRVEQLALTRPARLLYRELGVAAPQVPTTVPATPARVAVADAAVARRDHQAECSTTGVGHDRRHRPVLRGAAGRVRLRLETRRSGLGARRWPRAIGGELIPATPRSHRRSVRETTDSHAEATWNDECCCSTCRNPAGEVRRQDRRSQPRSASIPGSRCRPATCWKSADSSRRTPQWQFNLLNCITGVDYLHVDPKKAAKAGW